MTLHKPQQWKEGRGRELSWYQQKKLSLKKWVFIVTDLGNPADKKTNFQC